MRRRRKRRVERRWNVMVRVAERSGRRMKRRKEMRRRVPVKEG